MTPSSEGVLSVMMPIYNEERTLPTILTHVLERPEVGEVIAVDDGSSDRSWDLLTEIAARDQRVRPLRQPQNAGKGAALRRAVGELGKPFAVVQDADLEYDPRDYPALLEPLLEGRADVVYGVRGFAGQTAYSFWFVTGNKMLRSALWQRLNLKGTRFDIEPDITARILRLGYRIHEMPIRYYARGRKEGKKLTWVDGVRAISTLVRLRVSSDRRLFGPDHDLAYHATRQEELARSHPLIKAR